MKYPEMTPDVYDGRLGPAAGYSDTGMEGHGIRGQGMMDSG